MSLMPERCRSIGFNDDVRAGDRSFHVQTEVVGSVEMTVRSTVLEGGIVRYATKRRLPPDLKEIAVARALVEAHHQETLGKVASGEIE